LDASKKKLYDKVWAQRVFYSWWDSLGRATKDVMRKLGVEPNFVILSLRKSDPVWENTKALGKKIEWHIQTLRLYIPPYSTMYSTYVECVAGDIERNWPELVARALDSYSIKSDTRNALP